MRRSVLKVLAVASLVSFTLAGNGFADVAARRAPAAPCEGKLKKLAKKVRDGLKKVGEGIKKAAQAVQVWAKRDLSSPRALWQAISHRCDAGKKAPMDAAKWQLVWSDEFNGGDGSACYTRAALCQGQPYWGPQDCPAETQAQLKGLNKCAWSVFHYQNYMDRTVNNFSAKDVFVKDGMLVLRSRQRPRERITPSGRACAGNGGEWNSACEFSAGGLESRPMANTPVTGFAHQYGRFEIRAKLPGGDGSWPAHWLMPTGGTKGWPADGEIDILEAFGDPDKVAFHLHFAGPRAHEQTGVGCKLQGKKNFTDDFHVFAIEWEPSQIRYYVDDRFIGAVKHGERNQALAPNDIPKLPFYWILNTSLAPFEKKTLFGKKTIAPKWGAFADQYHYIDYVRVYRQK